ncbi:MAG: hypothetical protein ABI729_08545 [Chitinophagales bacterium]
MTIENLINKLKAFPLDTTVVIPGYEGGYGEIATVEPVSLKLNVNAEWYYGPHAKSTEENGIMAILLMAVDRKF